MHLHILKSQQDILPIVRGALPIANKPFLQLLHLRLTLARCELLKWKVFLNSEAIIFHKGNNLSRCSLISCIFLSCCIVLHPLENGSVHAVQFLKGFNSICSSWCKRSRWSTVQNQALCCKKGFSLAARPELLINKGIYLPLFSFSRPSQTLQLEVLHQHPQTNLHQNTHRYQAQHLDPATKLSIWFNPLSLKFGCLDVGYQITSVCVCVCVRVLQTLVLAGPFPEQ